MYRAVLLIIERLKAEITYICLMVYYGSVNLIVSVGINYNLDLGGEKKDTGGYYKEQGNFRII